MNDLSFYNYLATQNWRLAIVVTVVGGIWLAGAYYLKRNRSDHRLPVVLLLINLIVAPIVVVAVGALVHFLLLQTGLEELENLGTRITIIAAYLVFAWILASLIERVVYLRQPYHVRRRLPGLMIGLFRVACLVVGLAFALAHLDYSITGVWVSTSVAVAVIGFAIQKTLGDLFSGIAMSLERPFGLDDWLELSDGTFGQVTDINWRATRLRGWDGATHVIPNGELANQGFKNYYGSNHPYSPWYEFKIPAEVDPRFVKTLLLEAALGCEHVMKRPLPVVRLSNAQTIPYTYMVWVHFPNFLAMFAGREELFQAVHLALKRANIQLSPSAQELYVRKGAAPDTKMPSIQLALKSLDADNRLTDEELDEMAAGGQHVVVQSGKVILEADAIAGSIDIISSGVVEASTEIGLGNWRPVEQLATGDFFGIVSMLTNQPSDLRYTALTEVNIIRIDIEVVRSILNKRPEIAESVAEIVDRRLKSTESVRQTANKVRSQPSLSELVGMIKRLVIGKP